MISTADDAFAAQDICGSTHCITCADDGVAMTVLGVDDARSLALCAAPDGAHTSVEIALVLPVRPGDEILVHAGTAIATLGHSGAPR